MSCCVLLHGLSCSHTGLFSFPVHLYIASYVDGSSTSPPDGAFSSHTKSLMVPSTCFSIVSVLMSLKYTSIMSFSLVLWNCTLFLFLNRVIVDAFLFRIALFVIWFGWSVFVSKTILLSIVILSMVGENVVSCCWFDVVDNSRASAIKSSATTDVFLRLLLFKCVNHPKFYTTIDKISDTDFILIFRDITMFG